jgi:transposase
MKAPIFIRSLTEDEQREIRTGLRSKNGFVLRRCQILLASARGERASAIARQLGCDDQSVRNVIKGFNTFGLMVLKQGSSRPHRLCTTFPIDAANKLKELLHRSPNDFGLNRTLWTLELAAKISFEQGILPHETSVASVRRALERLGTNWKRAKHWMSSPDPLYLQKKTHETT